MTIDVNWLLAIAMPSPDHNSGQILTKDPTKDRAEPNQKEPWWEAAGKIRCWSLFCLSNGRVRVWGKDQTLRVWNHLSLKIKHIELDFYRKSQGRVRVRVQAACPSHNPLNSKHVWHQQLTHQPHQPLNMRHQVCPMAAILSPFLRWCKTTRSRSILHPCTRARTQCANRLCSASLAVSDSARSLSSWCLKPRRLRWWRCAAMNRYVISMNSVCILMHVVYNATTVGYPSKRDIRYL